MPYTFLTFAAARTILASRLQDPGLVYFNQPQELDNALIESLRFHQVLTGSYKQKITFDTITDVTYYDLPNLVGGVSYNATDIEIANNVLAALLEPPLVSPPVNWRGTGQFTFVQLQASLQNRLNRFLGDTGCRVINQVVPGPSSPIELVSVPDGTLDVRRVGWMVLPQVTPPANPTYPLGRLDEWAAQSYVPDAVQNPDLPLNYSVYSSGPNQLRLVPPPLSSGQIDVLTVPSGPTVGLDPLNPVTLGIPDDLSPSLKWGVLADILGTDGPSRDYARAEYAERRYQEFVQLAFLYSSVLTSDVNNTTASVGSVFDMDFYQPNWQQTTGQPTFVGMCGRNLACIGQTPDSVYGIGLWMVVNAFVGTAGQFLQVARDQIDPVMDYAQHVASFKMGGAEFNGTERLYKNLVDCAKRHNARLDAVAFYRSQLEQPSVKSELEVQRLALPASTR